MHVGAVCVIEWRYDIHANGHRVHCRVLGFVMCEMSIKAIVLDYNIDFFDSDLPSLPNNFQSSMLFS